MLLFPEHLLSLSLTLGLNRSRAALSGCRDPRCSVLPCRESRRERGAVDAVNGSSGAVRGVIQEPSIF
jgi:hypothetical protein